MNLYLAFLGEIFAIFHRKYLHFFAIGIKIFVKKICLERKRKNGIFSLSSPQNNISFTMLDSQKHAKFQFVNQIAMVALLCKTY